MTEKNSGKMATFLGSLGRRNTSPSKSNTRRRLFDFLAPKPEAVDSQPPPPPPKTSNQAAHRDSASSVASESRPRSREPHRSMRSDSFSQIENTRMPIIAEKSHPNLLESFLADEGADKSENKLKSKNGIKSESANTAGPPKRASHDPSDIKPSSRKHPHGSSNRPRHQAIAAHSAPSRRALLGNGSIHSIETTTSRYTKSRAASSVDVNRYGSTASSVDVRRYESSTNLNLNGHDHFDLKTLGETRSASVPAGPRYSHVYNNNMPTEIFIRAAGTNDIIPALSSDLVAISPVLKDRIEHLDGGRILDLTNFAHFIVVRIIDWAVLHQFAFTSTDTSHIANSAYDLYAAATELRIEDLRARMRRDFSAIFPDDRPCHRTCTEYLCVLHRFFAHATTNPNEQSELLALAKQAVNRFSFSDIAKSAAALPWENSHGGQMYRYLILAKGEKDDNTRHAASNQRPVDPAPYVQNNHIVHHAEIDRHLVTPPVTFTRPRESPRLRGEWRTSITSAVVTDRRRRNSHA
ncbi:hypothetical protein ABW21_db0207537 [Orbilia brochopaga]|nr:hypothetical protein ABW21_db0207537 [Drechslerella brochopaga]